MNTILAFDDEHEQLRTLGDLLKPDYHFHGFEEAEDVIDKIKSYQPNIILLDKHLGQKNSMSIIKTIRSSNYSNIPIVVITGDDNDESLKEALGCGADDFISKPFSFTELKARISAALRRSGALRTENDLHFKGLVLSDKKKLALLNGEQVHFTGIERQILLTLTEKIDSIVSRATLLQACKITGENKEISLNVHVCTLRKKIQKYGFVIKTIRNEGYVMNAIDPL